MPPDQRDRRRECTERAPKSREFWRYMPTTRHVLALEVQLAPTVARVSCAQRGHRRSNTPELRLSSHRQADLRVRLIPTEHDVN